MKKMCCVIVSAFVLVAGACSSEGAPSGSSAAKPDAPSAAVESPATPAVEAPATPAPAEPAVTGRELKGTGTTSDGRAVSIVLTLGSDNRISGTFTRDTLALHVRGVVDGTVIRCWLEPNDTATSWRGTLMAEGAPDKLEGTFALSDSGAAATASGTWKTL